MEKKDERKQITVRVDDELYSTIENLARECDRTINLQIVHLVKEGLASLRRGHRLEIADYEKKRGEENNNG